MHSETHTLYIGYNVLCYSWPGGVMVAVGISTDRRLTSFQTCSVAGLHTKALGSPTHNYT